MSTIEVFDTDRLWWRECCKVLKMTSKEAFNKFRRNVELKHQQDFYATLPRPSNFKKALSGTKIDKNYKKNRCIQ
jgi:hypothetical protein